MKLWWLLLLPGGSFVLGAMWLRRRWLAHDAAVIDARIAAGRQHLDDTLQGQTHDEAMEVRSRARREIADSIRKRSALVASGSSSASILKIVRKA